MTCMCTNQRRDPPRNLSSHSHPRQIRKTTRSCHLARLTRMRSHSSDPTGQPKTNPWQWKTTSRRKVPPNTYVDGTSQAYLPTIQALPGWRHPPKKRQTHLSLDSIFMVPRYQHLSLPRYRPIWGYIITLKAVMPGTLLTIFLSCPDRPLLHNGRLCLASWPRSPVV